jgi:hypothetical protein
VSLKGVNRDQALRGLVISILLVLTLTLLFPNVCAQNVTTFSPGTAFPIAENNAAIKFATNGSYTDTQLENGAWHFTNLRLYPARSPANLTISAQNTTVTLFTYTFTNTTILNLPYARLALRCNATGEGVFNINFERNISTSDLSVIVDWYVSSNGVIYGRGHRWNFLPDGTVAIQGLTGNVTISYSPTYENVQNRVANASFYDQHSVLFVTAAMVGLTVVIAVAVKVKLRQNEEKQVQQSKLPGALGNSEKRRS